MPRAMCLAAAEVAPSIERPSAPSRAQYEHRLMRAKHELTAVADIDSLRVFLLTWGPADGHLLCKQLMKSTAQSSPSLKE